MRTEGGRGRWGKCSHHKSWFEHPQHLQILADNSLKLNIPKTKELCREKQGSCSSHSQLVEQVELSEDRDLHPPILLPTSKLHPLKRTTASLPAQKLTAFNISRDILTLVYRWLIKSVLTFIISTWFNFPTIRSKTKLFCIINQACKIIRTPKLPLMEVNRCSVVRKSSMSTPASLCCHQATILNPTGPKKHLQEVSPPICNNPLKTTQH